MNQILICLTALLMLFYYKTCHRIPSEHDSVEHAGDIVAFISKKMVHGLGLTTTELMLARASAIANKLVCLIDMMLHFGVDFLAITPLTQNQLKGLRESTVVLHTGTRYWLPHLIVKTWTAVQTSLRSQWLGRNKGK